jgi:hypothetical protein
MVFNQTQLLLILKMSIVGLDIVFIFKGFVFICLLLRQDLTK